MNGLTRANCCDTCERMASRLSLFRVAERISCASGRNEREFAYGRDAGLARLDKTLDEAPKRGWTAVDMKRDWRLIFPLQK
jgi:hypothetical protein